MEQGIVSLLENLTGYDSRIEVDNRISQLYGDVKEVITLPYWVELYIVYVNKSLENMTYINKALARCPVKELSDEELILTGSIISCKHPWRYTLVRLVFEELASRTYDTLSIINGNNKYTGWYYDNYVQALVELSIKIGDHKLDDIIRNLLNSNEVAIGPFYDNPLIGIYLINNKLLPEEDRVTTIVDILIKIRKRSDKYKNKDSSIVEILKTEYETLLEVLHLIVDRTYANSNPKRYLFPLLTHLLTNFNIKEEDMIGLIEIMYYKNMKKFANNLISSQV